MARRTTETLHRRIELEPEIYDAILLRLVAAGYEWLAFNTAISMDGFIIERGEQKVVPYKRSGLPAASEDEGIRVQFVVPETKPQGS